MKIKRIVRLTAIILTLAMMPLWIFGCGRVDAKVSDRLASLLEGKFDTKAESGELYIEKLDTEAAKAVGTIYDNGNWIASTIENEDSRSIAHYRNIYTMTKAWATKGSTYYHKSNVMKAIKNALEYGYNEFFGTPQSIQSQKSWTNNERLIIAEFLLDALLILDENNKLSNKNVQKYGEILDIKYPLLIGEAVYANRSVYVMIGTAALLGNSDRVKDLSEKYLTAETFSLVTSGQGLYADGSYLAEDNVASSGSHGIDAFYTLTSLVYALNGTKADIPDEVGAVDFLYNWAINSVIPSIYNGTAIATTTGSYVAQSDEMGALGVSGILLLSELLDDTRANELRSIVKAYASSGNTAFIPYLTAYGIREFQKIESNNKLTSKTVSGSHPFASMDKLITIGPKYSAALSLSSIRSAKFETRPVNIDTVKDELGAINGQGWFMGDGMILVSNPYYQHSNIYWQYVNYGRLPGTTIDNRTRTSVDAGGYTGMNSYAGFVVNGDFSVSANLLANNNNEYLSDLSAKKSWFVFDDEVVCLGADISNTTLSNKVNTLLPHSIETVVENVFYGDNNSIILSADDPGNPNNSFVPNSTSSLLTQSALYFSKYGGVYVPTGKNDALKARLNKTTGGNFIELWFDHGATPTNATYEYALLPGASIAEFFEYSEAVGYNVISNNGSLQAVTDISSGATGFTFWKATTVVEHNSVYTGVIKGADFACTVLVKEDDTTVTVSIADFTHNAKDNATGGVITIDAARTVVSAANGLTVSGNTITVDRAAAASGQTFTVVFSK